MIYNLSNLGYFIFVNICLCQSAAAEFSQLFNIFSSWGFGVPYFIRDTIINSFEIKQVSNVAAVLRASAQKLCGKPYSVSIHLPTSNSVEKKSLNLLHVYSPEFTL